MRLMANPEAKIRLLGKEFDPRSFAAAGFFLMIAGFWAANAPCIAIPAITVGMGMMVHGTNKMDQRYR